MKLPKGRENNNLNNLACTQKRDTIFLLQIECSRIVMQSELSALLIALNIKQKFYAILLNLLFPHP